jgi:hypothetical protein
VASLRREPPHAADGGPEGTLAGGWSCAGPAAGVEVGRCSAHGIIGDHVGEGRYEQSERAIQRLLGVERELVCVEGLGVLIGMLGFPP